VSVMPVAQGSTTGGPWSCRPASLRASAAREPHSLARRDEPEQNVCVLVVVVVVVGEGAQGGILLGWGVRRCVVGLLGRDVCRKMVGVNMCDVSVAWLV